MTKYTWTWIITLSSLLSLPAQTLDGVTVDQSTTIDGVTAASVDGVALSSGASYLVEENFEETGTPTGWTVTGGTPDFDVTATPTPPQGSEAARFAAQTAGATVSAVHTAFTDAGTVYGYFRLYIETLPGADREIIRFQVGGSQSASSEIQLTSTGQILIGVGTTFSSDSVNGMSTDTWYHVFWLYQKGTGADGVGWVGFTTDGTVPTGDNLSTRSNMNGTLDIDQAMVNAQFSTSGSDIVIDRFLVSLSAIGANP